MRIVLPASRFVCEPQFPLAPPQALSFVVIGPVAAGLPASALGLTTEDKGLAARTFRLNRLLKKFCCASYCIRLGASSGVSDVSAPEAAERCAGSGAVHLPQRMLGHRQQEGSRVKGARSAPRILAPNSWRQRLVRVSDAGGVGAGSPA